MTVGHTALVSSVADQAARKAACAIARDCNSTMNNDYLPSRVVENPLRDRGFAVPRVSSPRWFHRRLPGYAPTPLHELPDVAARFGVGRVIAKNETSRLGLPAFKILGASWGAYKAICKRLGHEPDAWESIDEFAQAVGPLCPMTLAAATDGNHGRALAHIAKLLSFQARIWVPGNTAEARIEAIRAEGASVAVIDGGYDDAVAAAAMAEGERTLVISDTSWDGYEEIPSWIIDGYTTILEEVDEQIEESENGPVDMAIVPVGVGALGAAVAKHYRSRSDCCIELVSVEPVDAACCLVSALEGEIVTLTEPQLSIMAGLNCGTPSRVAWPWVSNGFDFFVSVNDEEALEAMLTLAESGISAGECAAAPLAALKLLHSKRILEGKGEKTVLLFLTEGVTDPDLYQRMVSARL